MKKMTAFLVVLALLGGLAACGHREEPLEGDPKELASSFMAELAAEDFEEAHGYFDARLKAALPQEDLEEVWLDLTSQVGPFTEEMEVRLAEEDPHPIVMVTIMMGDTFLDARMVFNQDNRIAGLFFQPSEYLARFYEPPEYADEDAFYELEVTVGKAPWALEGTLTVPEGKGPFPFVVLVHGSGPHDRDETVGANKPFKDIAWGLSSSGIGVLRYEKRTKEHGAALYQEMGDSLTPHEETVEDAAFAVKLLLERDEADPDGIFVLGHSLGAMLGPRIVQEAEEAAGLILMAGSPRPLEDIVIDQMEYLMELQESITPEDEAEMEKLKEQAALIRSSDVTEDMAAEDLLLGLPASYWLYLNEYDIKTEARQVNLPLLILHGGRDYQVTEADFEAWQEALGEKDQVTWITYPDENHLLIAGSGTPGPKEYTEPGNVSLKVIEDIAAWIKELAS